MADGVIFTEETGVAILNTVKEFGRDAPPVDNKRTQGISQGDILCMITVNSGAGLYEAKEKVYDGAAFQDFTGAREWSSATIGELMELNATDGVDVGQIIKPFIKGTTNLDAHQWFFEAPAVASAGFKKAMTVTYDSVLERFTLVVDCSISDKEDFSFQAVIDKPASGFEAVLMAWDPFTNQTVLEIDDQGLVVSTTAQLTDSTKTYRDQITGVNLFSTGSFVDFNNEEVKFLRNSERFDLNPLNFSYIGTTLKLNNYVAIQPGGNTGDFIQGTVPTNQLSDIYVTTNGSETTNANRGQSLLIDNSAPSTGTYFKIGTIETDVSGDLINITSLIRAPFEDIGMRFDMRVGANLYVINQGKIFSRDTIGTPITGTFSNPASITLFEGVVTAIS